MALHPTISGLVCPESGAVHKLIHTAHKPAVCIWHSVNKSLWFFWFVLTTLTVGALVYLDPEKARPSMDDGASAAEQMTMQQRVMKAVSLKNVTQSEASVS